jgi:protein dithiol:quinone oxidoreductase
MVYSAVLARLPVPFIFSRPAKPGMNQPNDTVLLAAFIMTGALLAVAVALVSQHAFDIQPCPSCVLQRLLFLAIAVVAAIGIPLQKIRYRLPAGLLVAVLALMGIVAAGWQHFAAAKSDSCDLTLAYKIVSMDLHLDQLVPSVFEPRATCAGAAVNLLGIPYDFWSLGLFAVLAIVAVQYMRRPMSR